MPILDKIKNNKPLMFAGAGVLGVGLVIYFRHRAQNNATATGTGTTATDNIDPSTGFPYGSAEDQQALQQMASGGFAGSPFGGGTFGDSGFGGNPPVTNPPPAIQTNAEWLQEAEGLLPNGTSPQVQNALLGVLGGIAVTSDQRNIFLEAMGVAGQPPQGYPQPIKVKDTGGHPGPHPKPKPHIIIADGHHDLHETATANGITEGQLIEWNPGLAHLVGSKKPIPKGTRVKV